MNVKKYIKEMKKYTKYVSSSKEKAQEFLQKTDIYTKKGNLKKGYRNIND